MPARIPMTEKQRVALLSLPAIEDEVVRYHSLDENDLVAIREARTPETRLGYALQLCCLRYPGRHLQKSELLPALMLDHIADQIDVEADVIALFARRFQTRYEQLASIKRRFGFRDLIQPVRKVLTEWLAEEAVGLTDGKILLEQLIGKMRTERIIIPGVSVIERMAGEAMHAAESKVTADVHALISPDQCSALEALLTEKAHAQQSRLSWLREPPSRVGSRSLHEILDKIDMIRATDQGAIAIPDEYLPRMALMAREGARFMAQALQQMTPARRLTTLVATLRELEATLTDAAISMFASLVGRANLNARKRLEENIAVADEQGRERLTRIAAVLEAFAKAVRNGADTVAAVAAVADLELIEADAALIRRTVRPGRPDVVSELASEYRVFKQIGHRFLKTFTFEGRTATASLRTAINLLIELGGNWRKTLPPDVPLGHIESRWGRHVVAGGKIDRTYWELATYFGVSGALASGDLWVPTSRIHRSLDDLITPRVPASAKDQTLLPPTPHISADEWIAQKSAELDAALLETAQGLSSKDPLLFTGDKLRFPKGPKREELETDPAKALAQRTYGTLPTIRITDVLTHVARWTGFVDHFGHVSSGLPPSDERAFLAALIAESTNLGLTRMADVCNVASRRALLRMQTWHMREDTFRAALGCLTDAIHAEPLAEWFGEGWRASADGQHFYLGGPGESGGTVNAHYGRDPIVKIYTTITDRYAPLHQTVIAGTAGEAIHALDGILGHQSGANISALHTDGGGVSDIVFAVMHLLGLNFEPRIPRLSDRRLYAFEPRARYGRLSPLFGHRLDANLIRAHWNDISPMIEAMRNKTVTPSVILKKLSAFRQQNSLAAALREIGRVERTLFTLRWFEDPALRKQVTAELNKGEARNTLARAVAFHRLGRFRDRGQENQQTRAAALNLVTAAIILFNCRYLNRAVGALNLRAMPNHAEALLQLSPLGWDHINLTGDYVWSDSSNFDDDGFLPLKISAK